MARYERADHSSGLAEGIQQARPNTASITNGGPRFDRRGQSTPTPPSRDHRGRGGVPPPKTQREEAEKSKAELIYHTAFGDLDRAVDAGDRLIALERSGGNSAGLLKALRWSSNPLRLTNQVKGAMTLLTEAFERASRLGLRAESWNVSNYVQAVAMDCEDLSLSLAWLPIIEDLAGDATVQALRVADYAYFAARVEYLRGNFDIARELLERSRALQTTLPRARGEQSIIALDVMLRVRRGDEPIPGEMLRRLRRLHVESRDAGIRDFEAAALFAGLARSAQQNDARQLFHHYLRIRRLRLPYHSDLAAIAKHLELS